MKRVKLTPKKLRDPDALGDAIDRVIGSSRKSRKLSKKVRRAQLGLQTVLGCGADDAWQTYLRVEEAVNARTLWEGERLVRWAFREGRRRRRRRR